MVRFIRGRGPKLHGNPTRIVPRAPIYARIQLYDLTLNVGGDFSPDFSVDFSVAGTPQAASVVITHLLSLSATSNQTTSLTETEVYQRGFGAVNAQVAAVLRQVATISRTVDAQIVARVLVVSRSMAAINAQAMALIRRTSVIRSAIGAQTVAAAAVSLRLRSFSATSGQSASLNRAISIIRGAIDAQTVARVSAATHLKALAIASAEAVSLTRLTSLIRSATDAQALSTVRSVGALRLVQHTQSIARTVLVSIIRRATDGQAVSDLPAGLHPRAFATTNSQSSSLIRLTSLIRSATNAGAASIGVLVALFRSATNAQSVSRKVSLAVIRGAIDAQVAARVVQVSIIIRSATGAQTVAMVLGVVVSRAATNAQSISRTLLAAIIRGITQGQTAASRVPAPPHARQVILGGTYPLTFVNETASRSSALAGVFLDETGPVSGVAHTQASGATSPELTAMATGRGHVITLAAAMALSTTHQIGHLIGVPSTQVVRLVKLAAVAFAVASTQVPSLLNTTNLRRSVAQSSTVAVSAMRIFIRSFGVTTTESVRLVRLVGHILSVSAPEVVRLLRLSSISLTVAAVQSTAYVLSVAKRLATSSPSLVTSSAMRTFIRAFATTNAQTVRLIRLSGHLVTIASASVVAAIRSVSLLRFIATPQALALVRQVGWRTALEQTSSMALRVGRLLFVNVLTSLLQVVSGSAKLDTHPMVVDVASPSVAAMTKGYPRAFGVLSQSIVSLAALLHRFLPLSQRRRVVRLPTPQQAVTLPPANRRVRLPEVQTMVMLPPSVRRVVLPEEVDEMSDYEVIHPEPAYFSPFDPTDQEQFTFDWSRRGYPGDTIVFASVVSLPPGLNIVGPAFIDGQLVEVTLGPMAVPLVQPAQYALRCMAVFHSGRISNYSIPVQVRTL